MNAKGFTPNVGLFVPLASPQDSPEGVLEGFQNLVVVITHALCTYHRAFNSELIDVGFSCDAISEALRAMPLPQILLQKELRPLSQENSSWVLA